MMTPEELADAQYMASLEEGRLAGEAYARRANPPSIEEMRRMVRDLPGFSQQPVVNKWCPECDTMIPVGEYVEHMLDMRCTRVGCDRTSLAVGNHHPKHCPLGQPF